MTVVRIFATNKYSSMRFLTVDIMANVVQYMGCVHVINHIYNSISRSNLAEPGWTIRHAVTLLWLHCS